MTYRNAYWYADPTAGMAMGRVRREERQKRRRENGGKRNAGRGKEVSFRLVWQADGPGNGNVGNRAKRVGDAPMRIREIPDESERQEREGA